MFWWKGSLVSLTPNAVNRLFMAHKVFIRQVGEVKKTTRPSPLPVIFCSLHIRPPFPAVSLAPWFLFQRLGFYDCYLKSSWILFPFHCFWMNFSRVIGGIPMGEWNFYAYFFFFLSFVRRLDTGKAMWYTRGLTCVPRILGILVNNEILWECVFFFLVIGCFC